MGMKNLDFIFLVTEDNEILDFFCEKFPGKVIYVPGKRYSLINSDDWIWQSEETRSRDGLLNGLEYLSLIKLLAECACIIEGVTGGSAASLLLSKDNFEYRFFLESRNLLIPKQPEINCFAYLKFSTQTNYLTIDCFNT